MFYWFFSLVPWFDLRSGPGQLSSHQACYLPGWGSRQSRPDLHHINTHRWAFNYLVSSLYLFLSIFSWLTSSHNMKTFIACHPTSKGENGYSNCPMTFLYFSHPPTVVFHSPAADRSKVVFQRRGPWLWWRQDLDLDYAYTAKDPYLYPKIHGS